MVSKLLVPLDGSPLSEQALPYAMTMAQALSAEIELFHAIPRLSRTAKGAGKDSLTAEGGSEHWATELDRYMQGLSSSLQEYSGLRVSYMIRHGQVEESVAEYVKAAGICQIVMATKRRGIISRWIHGGVAEGMLQATQVPVLLLLAHKRQPEGPFCLGPLQRILVVLDGSDMAERILPVICPIARALGSQVILFRMVAVLVPGYLAEAGCVATEPAFSANPDDVESYLAGLQSHLRRQQVHAHTAVGIGSNAECLIEYTEMNQIDMIAMCTDFRARVADRILGSVIDRTMQATGLPVLLVPAQSERVAE